MQYNKNESFRGNVKDYSEAASLKIFAKKLISALLCNSQFG